MEDQSEELANMAETLSGAAAPDQVQQVQNWFQEKMPKLIPKTFRRQPVAHILDHEKWCPAPLVAVLEEANSGAAAHTVTICRGYVFDSNCTHALPLTQEALNWCVGGSCEYMPRGIQFRQQEPGESKKNKNKNNRVITKTLHECVPPSLLCTLSITDDVLDKKM